MYKTVRHGENSLQYTILPQQDDLTGAAGPQKGVPGGGGGGLCRGRPHRRRGRTTTILVVTLLLVCSIVAGTVLVPLLLTTDIIAFRKLQSANLASNHIIHHHAKVSRHLEPQPLPTTPTTTPTTTTVTTTTVATTTTTPPPTTTTSDENLNTVTTGANVQDQFINSTGKSYLESGIDIVNMTVDADTTVSLTTERVDVSSVDGGKAAKNDSVEELTPTENNGTMLVTLLKGMTSTRLVQAEAAAATPPRHKATTEATVEAVRASSRPTVDPYRGWLPPRWPFADPSSYLQWTGYSGNHDSLLLPLLLGLVLFVLVLSGVFCYCMRRRHQTFLRREAIGKMSSDLRSDESADKASLLPDNSEEE